MSNSPYTPGDPRVETRFGAVRLRLKTIRHGPSPSMTDGPMLMKVFLTDEGDRTYEDTGNPLMERMMDGDEPLFWTNDQRTDTSTVETSFQAFGQVEEMSPGPVPRRWPSGNVRLKITEEFQIDDEVLDQDGELMRSISAGSEQLNEYETRCLAAALMSYRKRHNAIMGFEE